MTHIEFVVNAAPRRADVEPRTHLADFLRDDLLLTGTHIGCEQGVCGACTVLIDEAPARACITFAATCGGRDVRTIEGLEDDAVVILLRAAFSVEHALQCGYCTPGMLVTARDIVLRLPDADDDRIRLELAGNLCRCTGYNGIVKAIRRVLDARLNLAAPIGKRVPAISFEPPPSVAPDAVPVPTAMPTPMPAGAGMTHNLRIAQTRDAVWAAVQNPALIAGCVPGARLLSVDGGRIEGEMLAALGPIQARFAGAVAVSYDAEHYSGRVSGQGRDAVSRSRLSGAADFRVEADGPAHAAIRLDITYALQGPLAQFGRGPIVHVFAAEIAEAVARNLDARLRGDEVVMVQPRLGAGRLLLRIFRRALLKWIGR